MAGRRSRGAAGQRTARRLVVASCLAAVAAGCTIPGLAPNDSRVSARSGTPSGPTSVAPTTSTGPASSARPTPSAAPSAAPSVTAAPAPQLPRGGRTIFPTYRLVGYSGAPGAPSLGRLGIGNVDDRVVEIEHVATSYAKGRRILPVLELIATVVHPIPGRDGLYRGRMPDAVISDYLQAARRQRGLLLLNIQPGRADFLDEVKAAEKWLREPDVGIALDPEWAVGPGQVPGSVFGHTTGAELDAVARYVAGLVAEHNLPEKVVLYHQLHRSIITDEQKLRAHPGVALIKSVDGIGTPGQRAPPGRT